MQKAHSAHAKSFLQTVQGAYDRAEPVIISIQLSTTIEDIAWLFWHRNESLGESRH
jgi:hypothetical protein